MKRSFGSVLAVSLLFLAGCSTAGEGIPHWFDLQYSLTSYYKNYAQERGATCNLPDMTITSTRIVEETPNKMTLDVGYVWRDTAYGSGSIGGFNNCIGTDHRQFLVSKNSDGTYSVERMSGPQRS
ncbi:hypothetical protein SAMN07250955_106134 [Arboricoccus pini]|uniref:Lipoprotein n=1 Tax=Arboricoccus pini TaxID=1963835 RepID=A0A212R7N9_9PROT|nr:hypothetical protein [Arboricoccus pini]SNB68125.1 hypothetical protein SAMN07250955_106134 [Arboricoccus pini]